MGTLVYWKGNFYIGEIKNVFIQTRLGGHRNTESATFGTNLSGRQGNFLKFSQIFNKN